MMHQKDDSTRSIGQAVLQLVDGLEFTLHENRGQAWCLIEDESRGKVFRVGPPEYTVLSLLDGKRTLDEAIAQTVLQLGPQAIDEHGLAKLAQWTIESGIAKTSASMSHARVLSRDRKEAVRELVARLNPISVRIELFNPDKIVSHLEKLTRPFAGVLAILVWLAVVTAGLFLMLTYSKELFFERLPSYSRNDFAWFLVAWLALKVIHETAHAVTCKRYGGHVPQCGMLLLLLIPLPFVDVTSSWRFENKYQRILTSLAGMFAELFLASIALMLWVNLDNGVLRHHLGDLIIAATLHTLLFNANPLMRFDGYYALSDWLEIPNLATRGRNHVKQFFKGVFFGSPRSKETSLDGWIVKFYGWAALAWMVLVCVSLSVGAISFLGGVGMAMVAIACVFWLAIPIGKLIKFLLIGSETEKPNRARFFATCSLAGLTFAAVLLLVPAPPNIVFPVMVDYKDHVFVRAEADGFVSQILVQPGQHVAAGEPLAMLQNEKLIGDYDSILVQLDTESLQARIFESAGEIAELQKQLELIAATQQRCRELSELVSKLIVRSPVEGVVSSFDLESIQGIYVRPGVEILRVGSDEELTLVGMIDQDQAKWISANEQLTASVYIWGETRLACRIDDAPPKASRKVHFPAFAAVNGGPLEVTETAPDETVFESDIISRSKETVEGLEFVRPQIQIELAVDDKILQKNKFQAKLQPGQMGLAQVRARNESLGSYLVAAISRSIFRQL